MDALSFSCKNTPGTLGMSFFKEVNRATDETLGVALKTQNIFFSTNLHNLIFSHFAALQEFVGQEKSPSCDPSDVGSTTAGDFISLIDSVGSIDGPGEPLSWEGPVQR